MGWDVMGWDVMGDEMRWEGAQRSVGVGGGEGGGGEGGAEGGGDEGGGEGGGESGGGEGGDEGGGGGEGDEDVEGGRRMRERKCACVRARFGREGGRAGALDDVPCKQRSTHGTRTRTQRSQMICMHMYGAQVV
jgi:hypothetical protein